MTIAHRQRFFVYLVAAGAVTCMLGLADRLQGSPPGEALSDDGDHSSFGASAEVEVTPSRLPNLVPGVGGAAQNESATRAVDRLQPFRQNGLRSVLVHVRPGTDRARLRAFVRRCGAEVHHEYKILPNVLNLRDLSDLDVEELKKLSDVVRVEDDMMAHAHLTRSTSLMRAMQSQITGAGLSADGSGVRVCIIDTGINPNHIMYSSRIDTAAGRDFVNNDNDPTDDNGHGSNVAGIAVGGTGVTATRCGVSEPLQGVAPNATLIGVKVLSATGSGSFADVIAGIDYCADQTPSGGRADVINLSLGGGAFSGNCDSDPAAQAANNAVANGVVVVVSAGNEGNTNRMGTPACASGTIAVGAVYDDDLPNCEFPSPTNYGWCLDSFCFNTCTDNSPRADSLICFSNHSTTIDVAAPGCRITSATDAAGGTGVSDVCGTSQAAPHVAGLAALILSADAGLAPADVRQIIRDGAIDLGPAGFDTGYGWGRVDAINSLQLVGPGCTIDGDCDDGVFCNGAETCVGGTCQAGTTVDCNDGVACTDDSCNEGTASCDNIANDANCDNGLFCDGAETCSATLDCQSGTAVNCNDGVACTDDSCNEGTNSCDNTPNDANCDNGLFCDGTETCSATLDCQSGTAVDCNDGVGCTVDACNEATNSCDNTPDNAACDDGLFCNGAETCSASLDCQAGGDPCPGQTCDEVNDICVNCQVDGDCDDGLFCNGAETCVTGTCQSGTAVNCDDGVACTDDSCNEATASCDNVANDANCDNGLFCDGAETCDGLLDCQAGTPVDCDDLVGCTLDSCNEATNLCDNTPNDAACDDGLFCNGAESCHAILDCQTGTPVNCDDGVPCTDDACNETTNSCDNVANNANCPDDGLFCNGAESCDPANDCVSSGDPCAANEVCNETTNACDMQMTGEGFILSRNADFSTDDRTFNRNETLYMLVWTDAVDFNDIKKKQWELKDPNKKKVKQNLTNNFDITYTASFILADLPSTSTSWTWKSSVQDNAGNQFKPTTTITVLDAPQCSVDADCADGLFCNGTEVCNAGTCQSGTPVNCGDGVACTDDSCNEATASCDNVANDANCDNGLFCDGTETCDALLDCQAGTPVNCDDGVACTDDSCNEGTASCDNTANDANCDNGLFCDGAETCDAVFDCQPGGDPCPGLGCDEATNSCTCLVDADCDDGVFCNGTEACVAGACQNGAAVNCDDGVACTDDSCNEATASCDNVANDANCDNGLFCDGTETCDAALGCLAGTDPCAPDPCNEGNDTCGGGLTGEGFILSRNADFSTDDRTFNRNETLYMLVWTDAVDFNDIKKKKWELKDPNKKKVKQNLTNNFDITYTASFILADLPSTSTSWTWKSSVQDNAGNQYKPSTTITVSP